LWESKLRCACMPRHGKGSGGRGAGKTASDAGQVEVSKQTEQHILEAIKSRDDDAVLQRANVKQVGKVCIRAASRACPCLPPPHLFSVSRWRQITQCTHAGRRRRCGTSSSSWDSRKRARRALFDQRRRSHCPTAWTGSASTSKRLLTPYFAGGGCRDLQPCGHVQARCLAPDALLPDVWPLMRCCYLPLAQRRKGVSQRVVRECGDRLTARGRLGVGSKTCRPSFDRRTGRPKCREPRCSCVPSAATAARAGDPERPLHQT